MIWTSGTVGPDLRADLALQWRSVPRVFQAAKAQEAAATFLSGSIAASQWSNPSCGVAIGRDGLEVPSKPQGKQQQQVVRTYHTVTSAQVRV